MSVSLPSFADDDHEKARRLLESGDILALEVILQKAHNIQPGKILEVELETDKDRKVYEIEILARDGKVLELVFDARSGEHISTKNED
ncbi:MAG: PepSY domain-containing protein [Gammaproteobacteria bacterium]|nr:PepSY domain-containing protein [Gammaproteobacteria bacterium]MDH5734854.1 PepSY domain-containing protein [Gammaproteobacteria bacterium]